MNKDSFYAKRLKIMIAIYGIEREVNDIMKVCAELNLAEADTIDTASADLHKYILESKIMRFKPYCQKILTDIRDIVPESIPKTDF